MKNRDYETKTTREQIGPVSLALETIADLDRAIDQLCEGVDEKSAEAVFAESLCPYFGVLWPAARALSEHMARMGGWLQQKTVIEVGCGLALPSLVCAKLGAEVLATDFHPDVPRFLERNMKHNALAPNALRYREVDWRHPPEDLGTFDFVLGSDILYEASHPQNVARTLAALCGKAGHVVLTDPGRPYLESCVTELKALGFHSELFVREVLDTRADRAGDRKTKEVFVVTLQNRR